MHSLMKAALGPAVTQLTKLRTEYDEQIEDQAEQRERWVEYYSKRYAQDLPEHSGMEVVLASFGVDVEFDKESTKKELSEAISAP